MHRKRLGLALVGSLLAACTTTLEPRVERPAAEAAVKPPSNYNFDYTLQDRERVKLIQAFDDGHKTYLQFTRAPTQPIVVANADDSAALAYLGDGPYLVVPGVYHRLSVMIGAESASITNTGPGAPGAATVAASPAAYTPPAPPEAVPSANDGKHAEELQLEIDSLHGRIRQLETQLAAARAAERRVAIYINESGPSPRIVIQFADNSTVVDLDDSLAHAVSYSAQAAKHVYLHGRTDSFRITPGATQLALDRAVAVKRLLVADGMPADRIRIFYRGAGAFVADNLTSDGKAANRRVEIQMLKN